MQKTKQSGILLAGVITAAAVGGCVRSSPQRVEIVPAPSLEQITPAPAAPVTTASSPAAASPRPSAAPETQSAAALTRADTDYLRWLAAFDMQRQQFNAKQQQSLAALTGGANASAPTGLSQFSAAVQTMAADCVKAATQFQQRQPPPTCLPVATAYGQYLTAMAQKMAQAASATTGSAKTPQDQAFAVLSALTGRTAIDVNQAIYEFSAAHPDAPSEFRRLQVH